VLSYDAEAAFVGQTDIVICCGCRSVYDKLSTERQIATQHADDAFCDTCDDGWQCPKCRKAESRECHADLDVVWHAMPAQYDMVKIAADVTTPDLRVHEAVLVAFALWTWGTSHECVGLLLGTKSDDLRTVMIDDVILVRNAAEKSTRGTACEIDPDDFSTVSTDAEQRGRVIVGWIHSHRQSDHVLAPSIIDIVAQTRIDDDAHTNVGIILHSAPQSRKEPTVPKSIRAMKRDFLKAGTVLAFRLDPERQMMPVSIPITLLATAPARVKADTVKTINSWSKFIRNKTRLSCTLVRARELADDDDDDDDDDADADN